MAEKDIQTDIMVAASARGHRLLRNNTGRAKYVHKGKTTFVPYGVGGVGGFDLMGWCVDGVFAGIECKDVGEDLEPDQKRFHAAARKSNPFIRIGVAHSVAEAMAILEPETARASFPA